MINSNSKKIKINSSKSSNKIYISNNKIYDLNEEIFLSALCRLYYLYKNLYYTYSDTDTEKFYIINEINELNTKINSRLLQLSLMKAYKERGKQKK